MKKHLFLLFIFSTLFISTKLKGQIMFSNYDFESDLNCDPDDCLETDISCIEGWWNFFTSVEEPYAWIYYDDYFQCATNNLALNSCGDERGMRLFGSTGNEGRIAPTTENPFFGKSPTAAYNVNFKVNIIDKNTTQGIVQIFVADQSDGSYSDLTFIGEYDNLTLENYCYNINIVVDNPLTVEKLVGNEFIIFYIYGTSMTPPAPSSTLVDAVLDGVEACTLFDLSVSRMECNNICLQVDTDCINSCNDAKSYDPELDDCYISVVWLEDDVLGDLVDECYTPDIEPFECCISPAEPGNYVAYVTVVHPDNSQAVIHIIDVNFQPCTTLVVL